jgi:hypothetical protein
VYRYAPPSGFEPLDECVTGSEWRNVHSYEVETHDLRGDPVTDLVKRRRQVVCRDEEERGLHGEGEIGGAPSTLIMYCVPVGNRHHCDTAVPPRAISVFFPFKESSGALEALVCIMLCEEREVAQITASVVVEIAARIVS